MPKLYSRQPIAANRWRISNTTETVFCADCLEDAIRHKGTTKIFNSVPGSQFTSAAFTDVLKREGVTISMAGACLCRTALAQREHEDVYLKGYALMGKLLLGLADYFAFYNCERSHQSACIDTLGLKLSKTIEFSQKQEM